MSFSTFLSNIKTELAHTKILSDPSDEKFKSAIERWTDINLQIPGAIIMIESEDDILKIVNIALKNNVPFVPKSGGHSAWSTIGSEGVIIDTSNFASISVDKSTQTVQVRGGVQNKDLIAAVYQEGFCVPLGGANSVGVIPQALGGGICALTHLCGNTSDNILSARLITAAGELITVDSTTPDLLWALKGAGQFFGLVTEITLQAYPLSILGTDDGTLWMGMFMFDLAQVGEVTKAIEGLIDDQENNAACLFVITSNPQSGDPCAVLMPLYFGPEISADRYFAPLKALNPIMATGGMTSYTDINNGTEPFCVKGGFKRFNLAGLPSFNAASWPKIAQNFVDLIKACPDAQSGGYGFEFLSGKAKCIEQESAWAHRDVKLWAESLSWYTNPESGPEVDKFEAKAIALATEGFRKEEIHAYQNFSRGNSLESRFGGKEKVEKLQALKRKWDPTGVFTNELL